MKTNLWVVSFKPSYYFPHYWRLKTSKTTSFSNSLFSISLFGEISPLNKNTAPRLPEGRRCGRFLWRLALRRARDLSALLSERRLLSAELKNREALGDGAQLYKISLSFILRHRPHFLPSFLLLLSFPSSSSSADFYWISFAYSCWSSSDLQFPHSKFWIACFCNFFDFLGFIVEENLNPWRPLRFTERPTTERPTPPT